MTNDKEKRIAEWKQRREEEARKNEEFRLGLQEKYGTAGHPREGELWRIAWDEGHSSGYHEVEWHYDEMATLLDTAVYAELATVKAQRDELSAALRWSGREDSTAAERLRALVEDLPNELGMAGWAVWLRRRAKIIEDALAALEDA